MGYRNLKGLGLVFGIFLITQFSANAQKFTGTNAPGTSTNFNFRIAASVTNFTLNIPTNGSGYSFLYLRRGLPPTESAYEYSSTISALNNRITLELPQAVATNWHVRIVTPEDSGTHSFSLNVSSNVPSARTVLPVFKPLAFSTTGSLNAGTWNYYHLEVSTNPISLRILLSGTTRLPDLYVQKGKVPTTASYLKRSVNQTNDVVSLNDTELTPGSYYIGVHSPSLASTYTLKSEVIKIVPLTYDPG
ncbi:MAG: hypothetical protein ACK4UN_16315, partial [Limisphaerales bacterium]